MGMNVELRKSLKEQSAKTVAALTPARRSWLAISVGAALVVLGIALWSVVIALIAAGIFLIVYGAVIVDLDAAPKRRRRSPKVTS